MLFLNFTIATTPEQVIARVVGAGWRHRQSLLFVPVTDLIALHEAGAEASGAETGAKAEAIVFAWQMRNRNAKWNGKGRGRVVA